MRRVQTSAVSRRPWRATNASAAGFPALRAALRSRGLIAAEFPQLQAGRTPAGGRIYIVRVLDLEGLDRGERSIEWDGIRWAVRKTGNA